MNVARILYPVKVLGPGNRIGIWVCGCTRGCPGCSNPELWQKKEEYEISISDMLQLINKIRETNPVDGFTISGGEPFLQNKELSSLIDALLPISSDILIYTGYTLQELIAKEDPAINNILEKISVLIDGPYIEQRNNDVFLRGSDNQQIHVLNSEMEKKYREYLACGKNNIQNFVSRDGIISVGIHRKDFSA